MPNIPWERVVRGAKSFQLENYCFQKEIRRNKRKANEKWESQILAHRPIGGRLLWGVSFEATNAQGFSITEVLDFCTTLFLKAHTCQETRNNGQGVSPRRSGRCLQWKGGKKMWVLPQDPV